MEKFYGEWENLKAQILSIKDPVIKGLFGFLMTTGSRIMEVLPNPKYRTFLSVKDSIPNSKGVIRLPLVLKKKTKKTPKRIAVVYDIELFQPYVEYLMNHRYKWENPLLKNSWFYPYYFFRFIESMSYWVGKKGLDVEEFLNRNRKYFKKYDFYLKWDFIFSLRKEGKNMVKTINKLLEDVKKWDYWRWGAGFEKLLKLYDVAFPFTYKSLWRRLKKIELEGLLLDLEDFNLRRGKRTLYTHFGREYLVNILISKGAREHEIKELLAWDKFENINYYIRPNVELLRGLIDRFSALKSVSAVETQTE